MHLALSGALLSGAIIDLDGSFFLQLGIFLVLFVAMRELVFKPLLAVFDARDAALDGAKRSARRLETEAAEKLQDFETRMNAAKVEMAAERDRLRKDGQALERDLLAKGREDAETLLDEAAKRLDREATEIRGSLKTTVPALAGQIAEKLLGRKAA